jgi:diguanylate cyclase (GGDEF)-like protein
VTQLSAAYSTPATRLVRWLVEPGAHAPREIHPQLIAGLFGTLVIFFGGVFNTIAVSSVAVFRHPTVPFVGWAAYEVLLGATRLVVLRHAHRAARQQQPTPTDAYVLLALCWAAGVGYGGYMGLASGDWLLACLTGISAAAMGGGIAFRNFYAPRLSAIMVALSFGPCGIAAALSSQHALWLLVPQVPVYIFGLCQAVYALNRMLVRTIAAERENDRRATHDQLTGLANRTGLERAIVEWQRQPGGPEALAILYCDLDGFKAVNDRHGHAAGDALLRTVAERLRMAVPEGGLAARIGGDEFVLLIPDAERSRTHARAERVIVAIAERRYELDDDVSVAIGASIGVARSPEHGQDVATLMSAADAALYEAKARGRCRAVVARTPALRIAASGTALRRAGMR